MCISLYFQMDNIYAQHIFLQSDKTLLKVKRLIMHISKFPMQCRFERKKYLYPVNNEIENNISVQKENHKLVHFKTIFFLR